MGGYRDGSPMWRLFEQEGLKVCSGAVTVNVMHTTAAGGGPDPPNASGNSPRGRYGELSQLDQGFWTSIPRWWC
ncbi:hypothetical protein [Actinophytocola algeriensis]|uniref:Uncharacterized protein n=1 Tax=Actinophytocola algeriensis TaxID=1768010 RepID=A0A7W7VJM5_9PSEU|nr:hypothetical protein [Actinophytocola algeriensis]MBB4912628.1 hypothetical protein [Actinophytocola algeriensis]MBE1472038.1 hypothetical protein [Actinophytocola algeriensis]